MHMMVSLGMSLLSTNFLLYVDFISRGNKTHTKLLKVKKSDPRSGVLPKHVYLQYNSIVVDMKRNQKYQSFNKYNISD